VIETGGVADLGDPGTELALEAEPRQVAEGLEIDVLHQVFTV